MKTLHLAIMISLCVVLSGVTLLQNANATVPLIEIIISGGANTQSCGNTCFIPQNITIPRGAAVEWINKDLVPHTVVSGKLGDQDNGTLFESGAIWQGRSFIHNFNNVGIFHYFDKSHPTETGTITVTDETGKPQCCGPPYIPKTLESPMEQFKSGTSEFSILCNGDLQLILKIHDNSPACVKSDTAKKLVARGWGAWIKPYIQVIEQ